MRLTLAIFAFVMVMVSAWFLFAGFSIETAVLSSSDGQSVANFQLMHVQMLDVMIGAVSGLAGCVLFTGSAIVGALEDRGV